MNMANTILNKDLNIHTATPFTSKRLKYQNPVSRPASFNALANSLTRVSGGDLRVRDHLINTYTSEINAPPVNPATSPVPPMPPSAPQAASITPRKSPSSSSGSVTDGGSDAESDSRPRVFEDQSSYVGAYGFPLTPSLGDPPAMPPAASVL